MITIDYKDRRRRLRIVYKKSEPTLFAVVLRLALGVWQLLWWLNPPK